MKPHVAFLPSPGMGHIIPLFNLARHISLQRGFSISFLIITTEASRAQTRFFEEQSKHLPEDFRLITLPAADVSSIMTDNMPVVAKLCIIVRDSIKPLKSILAGINPNALIIDMFTTEAIDVCTELSMPVYSFFTASTALLALSLYLPTLDSEGKGEFIDVIDKPVIVPGCRLICVQDIVDMFRNNGKDDYKWFWLHVNRLLLVSGIFTNTWEALDPSYLNALRENQFFREIPIPPIYPIGPLIKDEEFLAEQDDEIIAWLHNQPSGSVLFISFGSGGALSSKELTELAAGLEMSRQRFILVVRRPRDIDANAGASFFDPDNGIDPSAYLPDGFVERTRGIGLVVPNWAPQVAVLRNPSTGGFLSHCGWNSTLESLAHGVPMIAWPLYAEQAMNATLLVEEIGVAVRAAAMERKEVERVVRAVMQGEEGKAVRKRAKELEETAGKAMERAGSSFNALSRAMEAIDKFAMLGSVNGL